MPIDPRSIFEFGVQVGDTWDTETARRSAVSRIYYGVFLEVRERFNVRQRRRSHNDVRSAFARGTSKQFGDQLADLRELREEADYDLASSNWDDKLQRAIRLADRISRELQR